MEEEVEILKSIYYDDIIKVELNCPSPHFEILLYPSNTDDEENNKLIKLNLTAYFPPDYPNEAACFEFKYVKGMTDDNFNCIQKEVNELAKNIRGEPMLFEIIQFIKDKLSDIGSLPETYKCSICLDNFDGTANTYNLKCYHYFHIGCLAKHLEYMRQDIENERAEAELNKLKWNERIPNCPDCRADLANDELKHFLDLKSESNPSGEKAANSAEIVISDKVRQLQKQMQIIYEKQKNAGGIIEENKQEIIILRSSQQGEAPEPLNLDSNGL